MGFALDLDGVVWLGDDSIPGAADAVARLRAAGHDLVFCTNNSNQPVAAVEDKLARHGISARGDVLTSAMAAASLLTAGERVLVCGGPGVVEAIEASGAIPVREGPADAVLVGLHLDFDYQGLREAATAVRGGARFFATNDDATYPTAAGPIPGGGAIVAAVATASGIAPTVAGKPHRPMVDLVRSRLGEGGTMVGDRLDTDGRFAAALGYRFALVLSGVTVPADAYDPSPDLIAPDLATLVADLLDPLGR
jgi:HAD superfamily hydrolase (TIGR01450 family)